MPDMTDMELVDNYHRQLSEEAFAALVQRHVNLVFSVALRHVGVPAHAEEITQAVFIILARKAAGLRPDTVLEGWLYATTRLTSLSFLRGERRRQFREQEAYMQSTLQESKDNSAWDQLSPLLDEAMSRLGKKDRDAVILRFFKDKNLREVAAALKVTEAAAQSRVHRALEKLQYYFNKRGVSSTAAIIAQELSANSSHAAPIGLAKTATALALAKGPAASASTLTLIKGALKIMAWAKAKTVIVAGVVVLLAAGTTPVIIKEIQNRAHLRAGFGPRTTPATESIKGQFFGLAQLVDAGNTTPEAAWESRYWARAMGDYDAVIAATAPTAINDAKAWMRDKATFHARSQTEFASFQGFQILARKDLAGNRVELKYRFGFQDDSTPQQTKIVDMAEMNGAWKCAQTRAYDSSWEDGSQAEPQP